MTRMPAILLFVLLTITVSNTQEPDPVRKIQSDAVTNTKSDVVHWGNDPNKYSTWTNHSNRLVPVYTYGITLSSLRDEGSVYRDPQKLEQLYGAVPKNTVNPTALYFDQTDIYRLQVAAVNAGYSNIILMVFDGMDWQTTRAAALYQSKKMPYESGRGWGLSIQDERGVGTDYGLIVTSPRLSGAKFDVNSQTITSEPGVATGGYNVQRGGEFPWLENSKDPYLLGLDRALPHSVTDSASSATSMTSGIKTYNGAINVRVNGRPTIPIARQLQEEQDFRIGVVTSVPVSHATPAAAYANNVTRKDYQDLTRDLLGLPSSFHRDQPLPGVDVLIGCGWGEDAEKDALQGNNFLPGNKYLHETDMKKIDIRNGGEYVVAERSPGKSGNQVLMSAAQRAADDDSRLLGYFGVSGGHLPYQTADGKFNPTVDVKGTEEYQPQDITENPTLAEMTKAALRVLEQSIEGFWLLVEAGDVDWANHANNLDNSIGAVLSGDEAFRAVVDWIEESNAWDYTAVIVTADHGHYLVIDDPTKIIQARAKRKTGR